MLAEHMAAKYVVCFCLFVYLLTINLMTLSFCPHSRTILEIYYGPFKDSCICNTSRQLPDDAIKIRLHVSVYD